MESEPSSRPLTLRKTSQIPGSFDSDEEPSPTKTVYDDAVSHYSHSRNTSLHHMPKNTNNDHSSFVMQHNDGLPSDREGLSLDETEMGRKLMDVESSFLPEQNTSPMPPISTGDATANAHRLSRMPLSSDPAPRATASNTVPPYEPSSVSTSQLESMSSSPTAAAAQRAVSRVVSIATLGGYETAAENSGADGANDLKETDQTTPTKSNGIVSSGAASPTPTKPSVPIAGLADPSEDADDEFQGRKTTRKRPRYLSSRMASQRSSYSSKSTTSVEGASDLTIGAEYALQSGGGMPLINSISPGSDNRMLRSISLGSMASGISKDSDDEDKSRPSTARPPGAVAEGGEQLRPVSSNGNESGAQTPRNGGARLDTPTDTVLNQRIRSMEVPGTVARKFRQESLDIPEQANGATGARVKNMTLKEQSSTIDKLQKENFKLKLKLYFMDQMLTERSDDAVKALVSENVELKTLKFSNTKEIRALKRSIRELEAKLREKDERLASSKSMGLRRSMKPQVKVAEQSTEVDTELIFLRERVETYQIEMDRLRTDSAVKEGEKRRLAEMLKTSGQRSNGGSDLGNHEEIALWKDLLETETSRKDQMEEENRRLQEEVWCLKADAASVSANPKINGLLGSGESVSDHANNGKSYQTELQSLRSENAELKRDLGAQTSMLTSRNKEKERLYFEIEDLKMRQRGGADGRPGSMGTGDSILERSASCAYRRPGSRASGDSSSRVTKIGDAERDALESANDTLRDELAASKLENADLFKQLDDLLDELEKHDVVDREHKELRNRHDEMADDLVALQTERDEALQMQEEAELNLQNLQAEADEAIYGLETDFQQTTETIKRLEDALAQSEEALERRNAESEQLRNEVRMMSEGMKRVEADVQGKVRRIKDLELEVEDINHDQESLEANLREANDKVDKLGVELESRQGECVFLREEQDGLMVKIQDLKTALEAAKVSATAEKDKAHELEGRLADERHQREIIGGQEKQEVQRAMNDLNREATGSKDEGRKLKKLLETREAEARVWKERMAELEAGLREVLGETGASKSSFVHAIIRLQKDLEHTTAELTSSRQTLSEKSRVLNKRDALLESHGLEARKLSELLEKERAARRADQAQHEQWEKTHAHTSLTMSQKDQRITELEQSRQADKKRVSVLEAKQKEQLHDRNTLLLNLWTKLSALCGSDWQHQNSLVNGHYPTVDVVANKLPAFAQHLLRAVSTIESTVGSFRARVRAVERDLAKDYQQLENNLDLRIKRLDRLESQVQVSRVQGAIHSAPEIAKLRGEKRLLEAEVRELKRQEQIRAARHNAVIIEPGLSPMPSSAHHAGVHAGPGSKARAAAALLRHHSTTAVEDLRRNEQHPPLPSGDGGNPGATSEQSQPVEPGDSRWVHRLRDLERRLKTEREGRLMDRNGARKRLEESQQDNKELKMELARERQRQGG